MSREKRRAGFTLIEVIIAVAIVAIMAGAVAPVVYHQINAARTDSTAKELGTLKEGLLAFYEDTGRFPTESEGLSALVIDPGVTNWQGPYVASSQTDPTQAILADAFGQPYVYDLNPRVNSGSVDVLVASLGVNREADAGRRNRRWDVVGDTDDQLALVSAGPVTRQKSSETLAELEVIAEACRDYFQDNAAFPSTLADLAGGYMDAGYGNEAFSDPWHNDYSLSQTGGGSSAPTLLVYSFGPDRGNDSGGDDDISVRVSSIPPGRKVTSFELEIAQAALNANPTLPLSGSWAGTGGIRAQLGLAAVFDLDGWGRSYGVNVTSRVVFSPGPDGRPSSTTDNIPAGVGP